MASVITLNVVAAPIVPITFVTSNIQEVLAVSYKGKYRVQIVVVSGRSFFVCDDLNNYEYDTQQEALDAKAALMLKMTT